MVCGVLWWSAVFRRTGLGVRIRVRLWVRGLEFGFMDRVRVVVSVRDRVGLGVRLWLGNGKRRSGPSPSILKKGQRT